MQRICACCGTDAIQSIASSTNNENTREETDDVFLFPKGAVLRGDNVITVVQVCVRTSYPEFAFNAFLGRITWA